jgi:hypothetical protein
MKRPNFGDVLKMGNLFLKGKGLVPTTESKFQAKYLGYLTGHLWGTITVLT